MRNYANLVWSTINKFYTYTGNKPWQRMIFKPLRVPSYVDTKGIHPDGEAWKKCCKVEPKCAFVAGRIAKNPKNLQDSWRTMNGQENIPFVCVHQEDDGYIRVCAGWNACFGKNWKEGPS